MLKAFTFPAAASLAVLMLAETATAQSVTVLGGGMARQCSNAALDGESDRKFEAVCTMAIQTEILSNTDRAGTYVNRGVLRLRRSEYLDARADFDVALGLKSNLAEAYVNRGAALVGQRRYADGLADLNKALELGVDEPEKAYFNRALAHEGLDDMKQAYFDYRKALELSPEWEAPRKELARFTVQMR
ncbi:tetratricopeptide repeat protein [Phenylobacterium sp. VNQ135]|uniref:tetratricopeptide repeat protein n=1 Tax=Phenylobacterium sp. VNQ135 TaxID=3400922 RepID=UPI003C0B4D6A